MELCGGTHVRRTGDIGLSSVVGESAVAAGVRRIEALTGRLRAARGKHIASSPRRRRAELRVPVEEMPARVRALIDERKRLERDLTDAKKKLAMGGGGAASAR